MDNSQQTKLCDSLNGIIGAVSDKKVTVDSANAYESNGIKGIRFIAKIKEQDFPFFVGFLADSKYSEHLVFGVLKTDVTDGINRLGNLDDDADGNKIQEKYRLNEKFFAKDAESQKTVLSKWINEQIQAFAILYRMKNGSPSKSNAGKTPEEIAEIEAKKAERREKTKKVAGMIGKFIWSQMIAPHMHSSLFGGSGDGGLHGYVCSRCGLCVKEGRKPEVHGCSESQVAGHDWIDLAPVGNINYHCSKCDLTIQTSRMPERRGCTDKGVQGHAWKKL